MLIRLTLLGSNKLPSLQKNTSVESKCSFLNHPNAAIFDLYGEPMQQHGSHKWYLRRPRCPNAQPSFYRRQSIASLISLSHSIRCQSVSLCTKPQ
jgi:hypothetical protein